MTLSVALVKALGGGWDAGADLATAPKDAQPAATKEAMAPAR
jgi:hypothetical protein